MGKLCRSVVTTPRFLLPSFLFPSTLSFISLFLLLSMIPFSLLSSLLSLLALSFFLPPIIPSFFLPPLSLPHIAFWLLLYLFLSPFLLLLHNIRNVLFQLLSGCAVKTTDGKCCVFPFSYKGVTYNKCTTVKHNRPWCSLTSNYKQKWGNCG